MNWQLSKSHKVTSSEFRDYTLSDLSNYPGYFRELHWFSIGLPEMSRVTWHFWGFFADERFTHLFKTKMTKLDHFFSQTYSLIDDYPGIRATGAVRSAVECGVLCEWDMNCNHFYFNADKVLHDNCFLLMWLGMIFTIGQWVSHYKRNGVFVQLGFVYAAGIFILVQWPDQNEAHSPLSLIWFNFNRSMDT